MEPNNIINTNDRNFTPRRMKFKSEELPCSSTSIPSKMKRGKVNRYNRRSHPYDFKRIVNDVKSLRAGLSQEFGGTVYSQMAGSPIHVIGDGEQEKLQLSAAFPGHDMVLESVEGFKIGVNRAFLASKSSYFHIVFNGPFKPVPGIHRLNAIPYVHLHATLSFLEMITTNQHVTEFQTAPFDLNTALNILYTATYLQMDEMIEMLARIILRSVTILTLITVYRHASIAYPCLSAELWKFMTWKFDLLVESGQFLNLNEDELLELLDEPALNLDIREESNVLNEWLTVNDINRKATRLRKRWKAAKISEYGFLGRPRTPTSILIAHAGWLSTGPTNVVEVFDKHRHTWFELKEFSRQNHPRAYHSLVATPTHLYSIGGFNGFEYYDAVHKMDFETLDWTVARPMREKRCYLSSAILDEDHFLAIGGYDAEVRFRTSEIYSMEKNLWEPISDMNVVRSDAHAVVVNGQVYVVGGFDGLDCHQTMEAYIPERNEWIQIALPMHYMRSGMKAVQIGGVIMVAGGFDGRRRLRKCEFYDPRVGIWHKLASMQTTRSNFGIEVFNSEVVVAGGYEGRAIVDNVESYDWRINTWLPIPAMSFSRSALSLQTFEGLHLCQRFLSMEEVSELDL